MLNDRLANDVSQNGTHSSGTDDDRVLRALVRNEMCWLRYCGYDVCCVLNVSAANLVVVKNSLQQSSCYFTAVYRHDIVS